MSTTVQPKDPAIASEAFPAIHTGNVELEMEILRLIDTPNLGTYRVQQRGLDGEGHVFEVTLFGATAAKVAMVGRRELGWNDYVAAMKCTIERELSYFHNRGEALPTGTANAIRMTVRDTDFAPAG